MTTPRHHRDHDGGAARKLKRRPFEPADPPLTPEIVVDSVGLACEALAQHLVAGIRADGNALAEIAANVERDLIEREFEPLALAFVGPSHHPMGVGSIDLETLRDPPVPLGRNTAAQHPEMLSAAESGGPGACSCLMPAAQDARLISRSGKTAGSRCSPVRSHRICAAISRSCCASYFCSTGGRTLK